MALQANSCWMDRRISDFIVSDFFLQYILKRMAYAASES